jgi:pimeloyl-ACP methyl ester carboxylesterase
MWIRALLIALLACSCLAVAAPDGGDETFDSGGVKIRYVTAGDGEAVVLIHGWMADSSMWGRDTSGNTKLNTAAAPGFRFIAVDCRGHGRSDKPHDPAQYGAAMAEDVVRLLDHLKIEKAHLVGYSMGAYIAGKVAATHPARVLSVVYGGQAPILAPAEASDFGEAQLFARAVEEDDLGSYVAAVMPQDRPRPTPEQAEAIAKFMFHGKDLEALAAAGRSFHELAVSAEDLKRCEAPVLFLHGANESEHVKGAVARAREALGRGEVKIIEGADHMTTLAKPEFGAALIGFLQEVRSQRQN